MIVVTAGTSEYRQIVDAQANACQRFGYAHEVFDLGGLGIGQPHAVELEDLRPTIGGHTLPPATFKAELVMNVMRCCAQPGEIVCWLDADCIPLKPFEPEGDFDVAVTLRPAPEVGQSNNPALDYLNSGVAWFRNTSRAILFLRRWSVLSKEMATDQGALNECCAPGLDGPGWEFVRGLVIRGAYGARVLVLDAAEWNCWHLPPRPDTRILHFKRGIRESARNYL